MPLAVSIEELSRYLDNEIPADELPDFTKRLASCVTSRKVLGRLQEVMREVGQALLESTAPVENTASPDCFPDEILPRLIDGNVTSEQAQAIENHAATCRYCLRRILEGARAAVAVDAANWKELPEKVRGDDRLSAVKNVRPKPTKMEYVKVQRGVMECSLQSLRGVTQFFTAATQNGEYSLKVSLLPQPGGLANIEFAVAVNSEARSQEEVVINIAGTATQVFRGTTSRDGRGLVRRLRDGKYDIFLATANLLVTVTLTCAKKENSQNAR